MFGFTPPSPRLVNVVYGCPNGLEKLTSLLDIDWTFRGANSHVGGLKWNCETKYLTSALTEFEPRASLKGHP